MKSSLPESDSFRPLDLYQRILRRWPWILGFAVAGGILGLALNGIVTPRYQATAILGIGVDYGRAGFLDEDANEHLLLRVQELLLSDEIMANVLEQLGARLRSESGIVTPGDLRQRLRVTRMDVRWQLSALDQDPERAAQIANAWAEQALSAIAEAQQHALQAAELQSFFFLVWCKPEPLQGVESDRVWVCDEANQAAGTPILPDDLVEQINLSRGIVPAISASHSQRAEPPEDPIAGDRALRALSGMLIGLLIGVAACLAVQPEGFSGLSPTPEEGLEIEKIVR